MRPTGSWDSSQATKGDNVFRDLVLARIIEPTSKIDAERVLTEVGVAPASYATVKRRLPVMPNLVGGNRWRCVCGTCGVGAGQPGVVRRVDAVLRDRYR